MAFDLIVRNGSVHDGSAGPAASVDIGVVDDRIVEVGAIDPTAEAGVVIDASRMAVAPGFVNMLSHSYVSMLMDPRSLSELKQGVTTQVFGEGSSMGPWTIEMRDRFNANQARFGIEASWLRLSEYLGHCEATGVSQNVASFIGATTMRIRGAGFDDRPATNDELDLMRGLVAEEMADGALGIGSALIYAPGYYASTDELVELCRAAAPYDGKYISHLRSEGADLLGALDEFLHISREAGVPGEVYHLKAIGRDNWSKMDLAIERLEEARRAMPVAADVYPYTAGATSLAAAIPPAFHEGGLEALLERLADLDVRKAARAAIETSTDGWENLYLGSGGATGVLILSVRDPALRSYQGRTLADIADAEAADPVEKLLDLVRRDGYIGAAYFSISEDNLRRQMQLPWVTFGSDAASQAAEGVFLESSTHPRAYGTFARVLGHYVRDERIIPLPEAIRRLSALPAANLGLDGRGRLAPGYFADIVVFDPDTVSDRATFAEPHQYAVGVRDVVVNGRVTLRDGEFTGTLAGRALHGPGRTPR